MSSYRTCFGIPQERLRPWEKDPETSSRWQVNKVLVINKLNLMSKQGHVYIMSNQYRTTFYIGVTSDLEARVWQHNNGGGSVFTKKYRCFYLICYEYFSFILDTINWEKQLKNWHRP